MLDPQQTKMKFPTDQLEWVLEYSMDYFKVNRIPWYITVVDSDLTQSSPVCK